MKKRIFSRVLALVMALSLLSTTAFAASFIDLQDAIDGNGGQWIEETGRYGYAWNNADNIWGIEAWDQEGTRNVQLNEDVKFSWSEGENRILIKGSSKEDTKDVTIDLNGQSIDLNPGAVLDTETNKFYEATVDENGNKVAQTDTDGQKTEAQHLRTGTVINVSSNASLTLKDTSLEQSGAITGGNDYNAGGIYVASGSSFTLESGNITGNRVYRNGGGVYVDGSFTLKGGNITGNRAASNGGGVYVTGSFTQTGGNITDNRATWGGGVRVDNPGSINMEGGSITDNRSDKQGGGINSTGALTITSGTIARNESGLHGGGIFITSKANISNAIIADNVAESHGGGVFAHWNANDDSTITIDESVITGNKANTGGGGVSVFGRKATISNSEITNNTAKGYGGGVHSGVADLVNPDGTQEKFFAVVDASSSVFYGNKHTDETPSDGYRLANAILIMPTDPTLEDYTFVGWVTPEGEPYDPATAPETGDKDLVLVAVWAEKPTVTIPDTDPDDSTPDDIGTDTVISDAADTLTSIEDEETPLAGLVTLAELLEALREYEGIEDVELPEDFQWIDHDYAQAIYWGLAEALVIDTEDEPLDPDEIVTVALLREVLENFVAYKGLTDFPITVEGEDDMIVMDLGEHLLVFYGKLEATLAAKAA